MASAIIAPATAFVLNSEDLWIEALRQLSDDDQQHVQTINAGTKLEVIADLIDLTKTSYENCLKKRWKFTRKSGEVVNIRDLLSKVIKWLHMFRMVGDNMMQYDPHHAAIPWAGVRFLLQIALNDVEKNGHILEAAAEIAQTVNYCQVLELQHLPSTSRGSILFKDVLTRLYAAILECLAKVKAYFEKNKIQRVIEAVLMDEQTVLVVLDKIQKLRLEVDRYVSSCRYHDQRATQNDIQDLFSQYSSVVRSFSEPLDQVSSKVGALLTNISDSSTRFDILLAAIKTPLNRVLVDVNGLAKSLQNNERARILKWLSSIEYLKYHNENQRSVLDGTGKWLPAHSIFTSWRETSTSSILWLHGIPGSGKTKLMSIVIETMMRSSAIELCPRPVFFYCSKNANNAEMSQADAILASFVRQLASATADSDLFPEVIQAYECEQKTGFANGSLSAAHSINFIIQLSHKYPAMEFFIDAIDECDHWQRYELLEAINQIMRKSSALVKVMVSSRDDEDVQWRLEKLGSHRNLGITLEDNHEDIVRFIESETNRLVAAGQLLRFSADAEALKNFIITRVSSQANGMFRWASLQLETLCLLKQDKEISDRLGQLPPKLEELYSESYFSKRSVLTDRNSQISSNLFKWLLCAQEELPAKTILLILERTVGGECHQLTREHVLEFCGHFVVFDPSFDTFRFVHLSVREFLERQPQYSVEKQHALAAQFCLIQMILACATALSKKFLCRALNFDIGYLLWKHPTFINNVELDERLLGLNYAYLFWAEHCRLAHTERSRGLLRGLIRHYLLQDRGAMGPYLECVFQKKALVSSKREAASQGQVVWTTNLLEFQHYPPIWRRVEDGESYDDPRIFFCSAFGFDDILADLLEESPFLGSQKNVRGESLMSIALKYREHGVVEYLSRNNLTVRVIGKDLQTVAKVAFSEISIMQHFLHYSESTAFHGHFFFVDGRGPGAIETVWAAPQFVSPRDLSCSVGTIDYLIKERNVGVMNVAGVCDFNASDTEHFTPQTTLSSRVAGLISPSNFLRLTANKSKSPSKRESVHRLFTIKCVPLEEGIRRINVIYRTVFATGIRGWTFANELVRQLQWVPITRETIFSLLDVYNKERPSLLSGVHITKFPNSCQAYREAYLTIVRLLIGFVLSPGAAVLDNSTSAIWSTRSVSIVIQNIFAHVQDSASHQGMDESVKLDEATVLWILHVHKILVPRQGSDGEELPQDSTITKVIRRSTASALALSCFRSSWDFTSTEHVMMATLHDAKIFELCLQKQSTECAPETVLRAILLDSCHEKMQKVQLLLKYRDTVAVTQEILSLAIHNGPESAVMLELLLDHDPNVTLSKCFLMNALFINPSEPVVKVIWKSRRPICMNSTLATHLHLRQSCSPSSIGKLQITLMGKKPNDGQASMEVDADQVIFGSEEERLQFFHNRDSVP